MPSISPAEQRVLDLLQQGLSRQEIADRLHLSVETVKKHLTHIRQKEAMPETLVVRLRIQPEEAEQLRSLASQQGSTLSTFVHQLVADYAHSGSKR